jgi:hypothetical protein
MRGIVSFVRRLFNKFGEIILGLGFAFVACVVAFMGLIFPLWVFVIGNVRESQDRHLLLPALVIWGLGYALLKQKLPKSLFAFLQICGAMFMEWYQIGKVTVAGTDLHRGDRWIFIIGGVIVIGDGFAKLQKEFAEAVKKDIARRKEIVRLRSSGSSAIPIAGLQAPEANKREHH